MGHGWVKPNANGMKARCGGPTICRECQREAGILHSGRPRRERCFCPCHTHPGTYPPPCGYCGHDTREGRMVGTIRDGWEPNDRREQQRQHGGEG